MSVKRLNPRSSSGFGLEGLLLTPAKHPPVGTQVQHMVFLGRVVRFLDVVGFGQDQKKLCGTVMMSPGPMVLSSVASLGSDSPSR